MQQDLIKRIDPEVFFREGELRHAAYFGVLNRYASKSRIPQLLEQLITLRHTKGEHPFWEDFGYEYAGVMALGYVNWLADEFEKAHIHRVYFMMRDGYIFEQIFERLYPSYESQPIYGSRTMFLLAGMETYDDIRLHITGIHRQGLTPRRCYERLAVEDDALWMAFEDAFPDLDHTMYRDEEFAEMDAFMEAHTDELRTIGQEQRKTILAYFESIGLFDGPCAIVDVGWKGSMLRGIEKLCKMEGRSIAIEGYYLGTHEADFSGLSVHTYGMSQGEPKDVAPNRYLRDTYAIMLIEAMFTAPFPSILGVQRTSDGFEPVYKRLAEGEQICLDATRDILAGCQDFVVDVKAQHLEASFHVPAQEALIPLEYLAEYSTQREQQEIYHLSCYPSPGNDAWRWPISKHIVPTFAVILTWPGKMSAEREVALRIAEAARTCGYCCYLIDNHGHVLDDETNATTKIVPTVDFILSLHYDSPKVLDAFTYFTIWNPPEIPLSYETDNARIINNYLTFDDYLLATDREGTPLHHLQTMLMQAPRDLRGASMFATSLPDSFCKIPRMDDIKTPYLFYCGMNWDILSGHGRNEGVMKRLDVEGVLRIFGPDKNWGIRPWAGYSCYQRPIPFDGVSILDEINKCGICLALSSDKHRRSSIATNRVFEACAAGAVIISDDNPMVQEMFGDSVLYIKFNRNDVADTCQQILEKYHWILEHRAEAQALAEKSQRIFREKYSLNIYLKNLVNHHAARMDTIARDLYAKDDRQPVAVFYVCGTLDLDEAREWTGRVLRNVLHQDYRSIAPIIAADRRVADALASFCAEQCASARVVAVDLYDKFGARRITDGQAIVTLRYQMTHTYFMIADHDEEWFFDHVTTLVRSLEDHPEAPAAYAGQVGIDQGTMNRYWLNFRKQPGEMLLEATGKISYPHPGVFLFRTECHDVLPDAAFDYLDGREYVAYVHRLVYHRKQEPVFSKRVTISFVRKKTDERHQLINQKMERNYILDLTAFDRPYQQNRDNFSELTQENIYARFIFPWKQVAAGSTIVIYGGGVVGKTYLEQILRSNYCMICAICDQAPEKTEIEQVQVLTPKELATLPAGFYDKVLIAIEKEKTAEGITNDLVALGIPRERICWVSPMKNKR